MIPVGMNAYVIVFVDNALVNQNFIANPLAWWWRSPRTCALFSPKAAFHCCRPFCTFTSSVFALNLQSWISLVTCTKECAVNQGSLNRRNLH
jgi:hypothetical protein